MISTFFRFLEFITPSFMGGGGGTTSTNTIQKSDPWGPLQPYLTGAPAVSATPGTQGHYEGGQSLFGPTGPRGIKSPSVFVPGTPGTAASPAMTGLLPEIQNWYDSQNGVNKMSPESQQAIAMTVARANQGTPGMGLYNQTLNGDFLNNNPYIDATFNRAADQVQSRVASQFAGAGRYGSGANQQVMGQNLNDLATQIYGGNYNQERARQQEALGMSSMMQGNDYSNIAALQAAGKTKEGYADQPYANLQRYSGLLGGVLGAGSSQSGQNQTPYYTDPLSQIAGAGMSGYALYKLLSGMATGGASLAVPV